MLADDIPIRTGRKHALVTGAANGLGLSLTRFLIDLGWMVTAMDQDISGLQRIEGILEPIEFDLTELDKLESWIADLEVKRNVFDLVLLNAGISATGKFETIPVDIHQRIIKLNATVPMVMTSALYQHELLAPNASLVFISSLSCATGYPGAASYAASKTAVATYAKSIRPAFRQAGIHVLCVLPGPLDTDHARRHAPPGASGDNRMDTGVLARLIFLAAQKRRAVLYPGFTARAALLAGSIFPRLTTWIMRRTIYDRIEQDVY